MNACLQTAYTHHTCTIKLAKDVYNLLKNKQFNSQFKLSIHNTDPITSRILYKLMLNHPLRILYTKENYLYILWTEKFLKKNISMK